MGSQRAGQNDFGLLFLCVLLSIFVHGAFVIRGFGEPDSARLAIVAADWHETGTINHSWYIIRTSPLYIHSLKWLIGLGFPLGRLPAFINWSSLLIGSLTLLPLFYFWRKVASRGAAAIGCALIVFAPAYWLANIYGMAHLPSFFLFIVSLLLFALALERSGRSSVLLYSSCAVAAAAALGFKADMVLSYGAFLGTVVALGVLSRRTVLLSLAIPAVALGAVVTHSYLITPSMSGVADSASTWSSRFPFTIDAITDTANRAVIVNSFGRVFFALAVFSIGFCVIKRRCQAQLRLCLLWAVPPVLFWGLKMGNSARHMMSPVGALLLLAAVVLTLLVTRRWVRGIAVALIIAANYQLGPAVGTSISPSPRLDALSSQLQNTVYLMSLGANAFVLFPVPSKIHVGGPSVPYAMWEVVSRSQRRRIVTNDPVLEELESNPDKRWPLYELTHKDGSMYRVSAKHVNTPHQMDAVTGWCLFAFEPGITVKNDMSQWRPFLREAIQANPEGTLVWARGDEISVEAGMLLADMKRYREAFSLFRGVLVLHPDYPDALYNAGMVLVQVDRPQEARQLLARFVQLYSSDPRADEARARLDSLAATGGE